MESKKDYVEDVTPELQMSLVDMVKKNKTNAIIVEYVLRNFGLQWSIRTLKRRLRTLGIYRHGPVSEIKILDAIKIEMDGPSQNIGYRHMHQRLRIRHDLPVKRRALLKIRMASSPSLRWSPKHSRREFRTNSSLFGVPSTSYSAGYLQANVAILPSSFAEDFSEFCRLNKAPCPVLYRSKPGELDTPLSKGSDIRTDITKYKVTNTNKSGVQETCEVWELTKYPWQDMVTFYIGCSFTFDKALIDSGIPIQHIKQGTNVGMYNTNIKCIPAGKFSCPQMVVSMRPMKKDVVEKAVAVTARYDAVHGAPIHIGDPAIIGINNLMAPDAGGTPHLDENEVPVFWGCGVTTSVAIKTAKPEICMSHSPGCMFVCDVLCEDYFKESPPPHGDEQPKVITLQHEPYYASVLGEKTLQRINHLEEVIQEDLGNRGIKYLHNTGELVKAALRLSHAHYVAIVTGFPCNQGHDPPDETDGPPGALAMAKAFQALGKNVVLIGSHYNVKLLQNYVADCVKAGILQDGISVEEFNPTQGESDKESAVKFLYHDDAMQSPRFDVLVAIEAVGRTKLGKYKTMNSVDLTSFCKESSVDELFMQAQLKGNITTIGIGDGGNEIGMGNVHDQVNQHIRNGEDIACSVTVNHLITAGVSNWGGWAVAMAVFMLHNCLLHSRYLRRGIGEHHAVILEDVLNSTDQEQKSLELLVAHGVVDGVLLKAIMSVDGLDFNQIHLSKLQQMLSIVNQ